MDAREQGLSTRDLAGGSTVETPETDDRELDREPDGERTGATADDDATAAAEPAERPGADEPAADATAARGESDALFPADENAELQRRWESLQTGFVDEPRRTVEQADELVAHVMQRLAEGFATERERLEQQWGRGEDISTEDLRLTLQRYRAFFQRLLSV